jgi:hypothetical protein
MLNAHETIAAIDALDATNYPRDITNRDERLAAHRAYNEAVGKIVGEFKAYLADTYASSLPTAVQDRIWSKAWEDGHASGYSEIENHYIDNADFAEFAFNAGKQEEVAKSLDFTFRLANQAGAAKSLDLPFE